MPMRPEFDVSRDISRDMYNNSNNFPQSLDDIKKKPVNKSSLLYFEKDNNFADINQDTKLSDNLQDNKMSENNVRLLVPIPVLLKFWKNKY